jgi:hypothetical protein
MHAEAIFYNKMAGHFRHLTLRVSRANGRSEARAEAVGVGCRPMLDAVSVTGAAESLPARSGDRWLTPRCSAADA